VGWTCLEVRKVVEEEATIKRFISPSDAFAIILDVASGAVLSVVGDIALRLGPLSILSLIQ
jgi:hypothetical protein